MSAIRKVVSFTSTTETVHRSKSVTIYGAVKCKLECGHVEVRRGTSAAVRLHCGKCDATSP